MTTTNIIATIAINHHHRHHKHHHHHHHHHTHPRHLDQLSDHTQSIVLIVAINVAVTTSSSSSSPLAQSLLSKNPAMNVRCWMLSSGEGVPFHKLDAGCRMPKQYLNMLHSHHRSRDLQRCSYNISTNPQYSSSNISQERPGLVALRKP